MELISRSPEQTEHLGRLMGRQLNPGMFLALRGELGGGKTCFTRGVVAAVAPESACLVASPTFAIMNEYPGTVPVYHFDFYRLGGAGEILELGFDDYFHGTGVCIVEWSERLEEVLPAERLEITFAHAGDDLRTITLEAHGAAPEKVLTSLAEVLNSEEIL